MPPLGAKERAQLPDSAFAYVDSRGRRRLPINDAAHVRNALARFSQVAFEDEGARDKARTRLLRAAGERCSIAKDNRSGLWGAQERARKALVHANKVRERAKRAFRVAEARERSAARHDRHAETLEAHGAKRAAAAERRDARLDRDAADAERER